MSSRQPHAPGAVTGTPFRWRDFRFVLDLPGERDGAGENTAGGEPAIPGQLADRDRPTEHGAPGDRGGAGILEWLEESLAGLCGARVERERSAGAGGAVGAGGAPGTGGAPPAAPRGGRPAGPVHTYRIARGPDGAEGDPWVFERDGVVCLETGALARAAHDLVWQLGADALGALDVVALHAGVLFRDGRTLLLPAPSGSGKSTLVAALVQRGWAYGSDEAALLRGPTAGPGPAPAGGVLAAGFPRPIWLDRSACAALGGIDALLPPALQALGLAEAHFPAARLAPGEGPRPTGPAVGSTGSDCPAEPDRANGTVLHPGDGLPVALLVFPRYAPEPAPTTPGPTPPEASPPARSGHGWAATPLRPALALLELITNCFNLARFGPEGLETLAGVARTVPAYRLTHDGVGPAVEAIEVLWAGRTPGPVRAPGAPVPARAAPHPARAGQAPADRHPAPADQ